MRAIQITEFGGPEVLNLVELPDPTPGPGQILVRVDRAGVNYADTHHVDNSYLAATALPSTPGGEVVGRTEDGRRVVALVSGGYAELALTYEQAAFDVPDTIDDVSALAMVVQGATAWMLLRKSVHMEPGESVVVHAAAGGVGSLAVQLARAWGAGRVIATASNEDKRRLALELGADVAVDAGAENMTRALREANGGERVDIVLDMTGGRITDESIAALAPFGRLAFYGMANRTPPKRIAPENLMSHSSTVAGMWFNHALRVPGLLPGALDELFGLVSSGALRAIPGGEYPLAEARRAHEDILSRRTVGKLLLDPTR
jgi:NADPH2:quinone reductase